MKKILIVEDDLIVRSIYRRKFEMSGYKVETAEEGSAALNLMPTFKPDLVQVDIMLPGIDGVEVIRQIRSWPDFKGLPILVLSSFYRPDLAKEAWKAGATKCVSKMDCTPNLALELIEQLLSGEAGFAPRFGTIPLAKGALDVPPTPPPAPAPSKTTMVPKPSAPKMPVPPSVPRLTVKLDLPPKPLISTGAPAVSSPSPDPEAAEPAPSGAPRLKVALDLPPSKGTQPTRPTFAEKAPSIQNGATTAPAPSPAATSGSSALDAALSGVPGSGPDFRAEIRQEFLKRAPLIQTELRERVDTLLRSKSTSEQLNLLRDVESSASSLASLAGITGFGRIAHLSGALDALIKELHKKPAQMTASVLRTIAHAADCMNLQLREVNRTNQQDLPQSVLILVVDDEPIARKTISVALGKGNLRCVAMEDPRGALAILRENPFDLVFLDAEMPGLSGFELCAELRKMPTNKTTPVIFVTSLTKFEVRAQSSLSGGNDLIAKPFLMMELAVKALTYLLKPRVK